MRFSVRRRGVGERPSEPTVGDKARHLKDGGGLAGVETVLIGVGANLPAEDGTSPLVTCRRALAVLGEMFGVPPRVVVMVPQRSGAGLRPAVVRQRRCPVRHGPAAARDPRPPARRRTTVRPDPGRRGGRRARLTSICWPAAARLSTNRTSRYRIRGSASAPSFWCRSPRWRPTGAIRAIRARSRTWLPRCRRARLSFVWPSPALPPAPARYRERS